MTESVELTALQARWQGQWEAALALWSPYTRLSPPRLCLTHQQEQGEKLTGSFAMIRLNDMAVVVSLLQIQQAGLDDYALEILGHEIGHHVYAPGNLTDDARVLVRMRRALPLREQYAGMLANLYEDMLINDRLFRVHGLRMADVYQLLEWQQLRALEETSKGQQKSSTRLPLGPRKPTDASAVPLPTLVSEVAALQRSTGMTPALPQRPDRPPKLFDLVMRMFEILWSLRRGTLSGPYTQGGFEGDAQLGARLIRSYAHEWIDGSGGFAALCYPYLDQDQEGQQTLLSQSLRDTEQAGAGAPIPFGLVSLDPAEAKPPVHPSLDPRVNGTFPGVPPPAGDGPPGADISQGGSGQTREPFEYGQILRALGLDLSDHEAAVAYYRERALPHRVPFPTRPRPESEEPLAEGLEPWDVGSPLEDVDWMQSVLLSPRVIPGMTTQQRTWGRCEGAEPKPEPLDLDIYVDCSGSMPNPQHSTSYLTLAGAIIALSALRVGSRVQATLWSGAGEFETTGTFVTDEKAILRILTGYLGGATAFPLHILRDTYARRKPTDRKVHILLISDDGASTMFDSDERGTSGYEVVRTALNQAGGGATMVLQLYNAMDYYPFIGRAENLGWNAHAITRWEELEAFAAAFSKARFGSDTPGVARGKQALHHELGRSPA